MMRVTAHIPCGCVNADPGQEVGVADRVQHTRVPLQPQLLNGLLLILTERGRFTSLCMA